MTWTKIKNKIFNLDVGRLESDISELSRLVDADENLEDIEGKIIKKTKFAQVTYSYFRHLPALGRYLPGN